MATEQEILDLRDRLQEMMKETGMSQSAVADAMGLSQPLVSRFLRGTAASPGTMLKVQALLGDIDDDDVLTPDDLRSAVKLLRYIRGVIHDGNEIVVRQKDGSEKTLVLLW